MLTQCPGCQTVFRVTSAILRAAHGQVRCGRCNQQFDAISQLLDQETVETDSANESAAASETTAPEFQTTEAQAPASQTAASHPDTPTDPGFAGIGHEDIVLEGTRIEISGIYAKPVNDHGESVLEQSQVIEEFNLDTEQWENPFGTATNTARTDDHDAAGSELSNTGINALLSDTTDASADAATHDSDDSNAADPFAHVAQNADEADTADIPDIEDELNAVDLAGELARLEDDLPTHSSTTATDSSTAAAHHAASADADNKELTDALAAASAAGHMEEIVLSTGEFETPLVETSNAQPVDEITAFLSGTTTAAMPAQRRWPWALAGVLALMVLAVQVVHHFRTELARHPSIGPVLIQTYAKLGMKLTPHWLVSAYSIKQWGMVSDPQQPGVLRMRASVTNVAAFAQPYPMLRFTLEDRFGATVGAREFKPEEYLTSRNQANRLLPSNTAANVDLAIVDPGPDAVGFQLDSCLSEAGRVRCAHDLPIP